MGTNFFGELIRKKRKEKGLTQTELGELLNLKKAAVSKYEKGQIINISPEMILRFCAALDITFDELHGSELNYNQELLNRAIGLKLAELERQRQLFITTSRYMLVDLWHYKSNPNSTSYLEYFLSLALHLNDEQFRQIKSYCQFITHQTPIPPEQSE